MMSGFRSKEPCEVLAASDKMTRKYAMKVVRIAQRVPTGIDLLGAFRSPDMEAPAKIPAT